MISLRQLRQDARHIFDAGLEAADPAKAILRHVRLHGDVLDIDGCLYSLSNYRNLYVIGAGKGSAKMARALEQLLGDSICGGIVIVKYGHSVPVTKVTIVEAGHPVPDENGASATEDLIHLAQSTTSEDLVLCLISGGGSALLSCPAENLSLRDKQQTTRLLLNCGAPIREINAIRKHMSKVKGGRLARLAYPSALVSLILSDVVGDPLDTIASGPTAPDLSTFSDCQLILDKYGLGNKIPGSVATLMEKGRRGEIEETPKPGNAVFDNLCNVVIGNNRLALLAAKEQAETLGYNVLLLSTFVDGEAVALAIGHAAIAKQVYSFGNPIPRPSCIISGGEATVVVRGNGVGGRNQEFALAAAIEISGLEGVVALSAGTDGTDGPTDAAGGIVDGGTIQRGYESGLDARQYLNRNDSYHFLRVTDDLLITGPTFTNVMDLRLFLVA
ncbi:MAG: glycerate kinase [Candidatus Binatia bacterium]